MPTQGNLIAYNKAEPPSATIIGDCSRCGRPVTWYEGTRYITAGLAKWYHSQDYPLIHDPITGGCPPPLV